MPLYPEIGTHLRETIQDEDTVTLIGSDMQSQRIRGFTTMRYINLRFTYLLITLEERYSHAMT